MRSGLNDGKGSGFNGSPNSERDGRLAGRRSRYKGDGLDDLDGSRGDGLAYRHKGDSLGLDGGRGDGLAGRRCRCKGGLDGHDFLMHSKFEATDT